MNGGSSAPIPSMYCDVTGALPALFVLVLVSASVLDAADDDVTFDAGCRFSTEKGNESQSKNKYTAQEPSSVAKHHSWLSWDIRQRKTRQQSCEWLAHDNIV